MIVRVLGSAAAFGVPRWDCGCERCDAVRRHKIRRRTHESLAVSADGERWLLLGASPDLFRQIESFDALHPVESKSPIVAFFISSPHPSQLAGLLSLPSASAVSVFAPPSVREALSSNPMFEGEKRSFVVATEGERVPVLDLGLSMTRFDEARVTWIREEATGKLLVHAPEAAITNAPKALFEGADCSFVNARTPRDALPPGVPGRAYLTHISHDDPLVDETSTERRTLPAPWNIAHDGLDLFV